jgi:hypothetical protein
MNVREEEMPTPSSSGIPSSRSHAEHWERYGINPSLTLLFGFARTMRRHRVSPSCMEANQANAMLVYSECLELGANNTSCFVQISGHFSGK